MKLENAIKWLSNLHRVGLDRITTEERESVALSIEAMKVFQRRRKAHAVTGTGLLPGETPE